MLYLCITIRRKTNQSRELCLQKFITYIILGKCSIRVWIWLKNLYKNEENKVKFSSKTLLFGNKHEKNSFNILMQTSSIYFHKRTSTKENRQPNSSILFTRMLKQA